MHLSFLYITTAVVIVELLFLDVAYSLVDISLRPSSLTCSAKRLHCDDNEFIAVRNSCMKKCNGRHTQCII